MDKVSFVIIGLGGRGHDIYGKYALKHPDEVEITAIADPREDRLKIMQEEHHVPVDRCFKTGEELLSSPKLGDVAVIATQDQQHVAQAVLAMQKGYHLLLEKPIAIDIEGCREVLEAARKYKRHVTVCHVLRYAPFYETLKKIIDDGRIGKVVAIQAMEQVGYWHFVHSYVRGNWRRADTSSPMILAKCCHDMDILIWLSGSRAKRVSSYGNLFNFKRENAPEGSADRCLDCQVRHQCPYDAVKFYIEAERSGVAHGHVNWPVNVLNPHPTVESITKALREGPYGKCAYKTDNDVADHQAVNIELETGATINFTVSAFTEDCYRTIKVMGTTGCVEGNMDTNVLTWHSFQGESEEIDINAEEGPLAGHGGGDDVMVRRFVEKLKNDDGSEMLSTIEASVESHIVALLAEESRLDGGKSLDVIL